MTPAVDRGDESTEGALPVFQFQAASLDEIEHAIADSIARWGEHLTGHTYDGNTAGIPCATANMAMSVIRKRLVHSPPSTEGALRAALAENERLRNGLPDPESIRYGIEAEPWEGNGPCADCEGRSPYWHVPNEIWDAVMGDVSAGVVCPVCFTIRAWQAGVEGWDRQWWWLPSPDFHAVPNADFIGAMDETIAANAEVERLRGQVEDLKALRGWGQRTPLQTLATPSTELGRAREAVIEAARIWNAMRVKPTRGTAIEYAQAAHNIGDALAHLDEATTATTEAG